ncbi:hypothetical protein OHS58_48560 [Amycolatopsis sp. NBC_00348]|uniref:hypothetical protein n=1 Tax=unclassified Amycolatopsis TaxID=2618356 RepID=UPI002E25713E|nr:MULTISPECIES: hypothetical protein [unclassified Amycolatopsis]
MSNARPNTTRRQLEGAADDLEFDALAIDLVELDETEALGVEDELAGVADLLAELDVPAHELPEFVYDTYEQAEFAPAALAPVIELRGPAADVATLGEVA